jgi:hypothetical protein
MYTKLFTLLLMVCLMGTLSYTTSNDRTPIKIVVNGDVYRGDTGPLVYGPPVRIPMDNSPRMGTFTYGTDAAVIIGMETSVDLRSQYDLQANGNIKYIYQNPTNPSFLHAVFMVSTDPGPGWDNRNMRYATSTNGGTSWEYIGTVSTTRSGFPTLTVTNDNRAIILGHCTDNGGINRSQLFVDLAPGVGSWSVLDPGTNGNGTLAPIWPEVTIDLTNNKVLWAASQNGVDSAFANVCTSIAAPPGTFVGYKPLLNGETAEGYSPAVGTGKYGVAFNTLQGGASYVESVDGGVTWGAPVPILVWNPADSMGTIRSIDFRYNGAIPQAVIGLANVDPVAGTFVPGLPSKMVFWSPAVNGGIPVTIDSAAGLNGSNPINDVFLSVTRGVIGSGGGSNVYVAYSKARNDTDAAGNNYFDTYFRYSPDNGATWGPKTQLTNLPGQFGVLHDCRYSSISPTNANNEAHILLQADSIAASNVNGAAASWSKAYYIKITPVIGINTISTQVPDGFSLSQNYPNPFNPTTKIKFAVPTAGLVTLKMYDVLGKEVSVLVNKQMSAGTFEYEFNALGLTSGVYFYRLESGNFVDTKKLVLVK